MRARLPLLLVGLMGCNPSPEPTTSPEVQADGGGKVVENNGPRWGGGKAWLVSDEPSLTIGSLEGADEYQFVDILDATVLQDGRIVIADGGAKAVRLFGADGVFGKTLGGPGFGPGEFQNPRAVRALAGGGVQVWDGSLFRSTNFDATGDMASADAVDLGTIAKAVDPPLYPGALEPLADGGFLVRLVEKAGMGKGGGGKGGGVKATSYAEDRFRNRSGLLRVSPDLLAVDTLMFFGDTEQVIAEAPWGPQPLSPPLAKRSWVAHGGSPHRICIGEQEAPEITCIDAGGGRTLVRWVGRDAPVLDDEVRAWRQGVSRDYGQKVNQDDIRRMLDEVPLPRVRPPHTRIVLDSSGYLWVNVGPGDDGNNPSWEYLVFDPEGVQLGMVRMPRVEVLEIGEDYVLGVFQDELEVEYLHLYGLSRTLSQH